MTVFDQELPTRITTEAQQVHFGRLLATVLAGIFYVIGWTAAKTLGLLWFAVTWSATAVKVGWQEGRANASAARQP